MTVTSFAGVPSEILSDKVVSVGVAKVELTTTLVGFAAKSLVKSSEVLMKLPVVKLTPAFKRANLF